MSLWQKHSAKMVRSGPHLLFSMPRHAAFTPDLEAELVAWAEKNPGPYLTKDLLPLRVGIPTDQFRRNGGGTVPSVAMSWAQHQLLKQAEIRARLPVDQVYSVLGVNCLVETGDSKLILARRSQNVSIHAGSYHVSAAGFVDLLPYRMTRSPLAQIYSELTEETGLSADDIHDLVLVGVCEDLTTDGANMDACYTATTPLSGAEVIEAARGAKDNWEGSLLAVTRQEAIRLLEEESFDPTGAANLLTHLGIS